MKENICIVGCGKIFQMYHLDAILSTNSFNIKYIIDTDEKLSFSISDELNCQSISDYSEIEDASTFFITAPPKYRLGIFHKIKDFAKNIIFEKPISLNFSETKTIAEISQRQKINIFVTQTRRFFPNIISVSKILENNKINDFRLDIYEGGLFNWGTVSNYMADNNKNDHGIIHDVGAHIFDVLLNNILKPLKLKYTDIKINKVFVDKDSAANNVMCNFEIKKNSINGIINISISRTVAMSNKLIFSYGKNKVFTRTLFDDNITFSFDKYRVKIQNQNQNQINTLEDVFENIWTDVYNKIKDQNYISKIELDSIIPTVKLIDDIINKREVKDLKDIL